MKSAKVVNKILLSSLAFGGSFCIGMLINDADIKQALATGAIGTTACVAGTFATGNNKETEDNQIQDSLLHGVKCGYH